jgi:hypothetical protein
MTTGRINQVTNLKQEGGENQKQSIKETIQRDRLIYSFFFFFFFPSLSLSPPLCLSFLLPRFACPNKPRFFVFGRPFFFPLQAKKFKHEIKNGGL